MSPLRSGIAAVDGLSRLLARLTVVVAVTMTGVMVASLVLQIVFRYGLGQALTWSEELALFLFTWIVLLVGSLGVREGFHVRLTLLHDYLPGWLRLPLDLVLGLLVLGFGLVLLTSGSDYVTETLGQVSAAVGYPIEALHLAAPVSGGLVVVHALASLLNGSAFRTAVPPVEELSDG